MHYYKELSNIKLLARLLSADLIAGVLLLFGYLPSS